MKNDRLSDALRRGDPAENYPEARSADEQKAALLARCAAEPFDAPTHGASAQKNTPRRTRWAVPALAGASALTVGALCGAAVWFGANNPASQSTPAQMVKISPRPATSPAPHKREPVPLPRPTAQESAIVQGVHPKKPTPRRETNVADLAPTIRATKQTIFARPLRQNEVISTIPAKAIVRTNPKKKVANPRLIADATKSQAAPALTKIAEPVLERVIIEQDATPAENAPTVTTVAITMNGRSESVIVARVAEPIAN